MEYRLILEFPAYREGRVVRAIVFEVDPDGHKMIWDIAEVEPREDSRKTARALMQFYRRLEHVPVLVVPEDVPIGPRVKSLETKLARWIEHEVFTDERKR